MRDGENPTEAKVLDKYRYGAKKPVFCNHCGTRLVKELSGQDFDEITGKPRSYRAYVSCPNRHYMDTWHAFFRWTEKNIFQEMYEVFKHVTQ